MSARIITPPEQTRLTTVANVRSDLGLDEAAFSDTRVERLIDQASAQAARICNRTFGIATYVQRFGGCDLGREIMLDASPVTDIVNVELGGVTLLPADYEFEGFFLYRMRSGARGCWYGRGLSVEFKAGWWLPGQTGTKPVGATDLPADIDKAVIDLIGVAASEAGRDATIKSETVEGVGATSYYVQGASASLPHPGAEATLMGYRRLAFA